MDRGTERGRDGQRHEEGAEGGAHKRRGLGREQWGSRHRSLLFCPSLQQAPAGTKLAEATGKEALSSTGS
eukprot:1950032-Pleurochrysis_carterae.AAC.1